MRRLRRAIAFVAVLAAVEGIACAVDARWPYRQQLVGAFHAAEQQEQGDTELPLFAAPEKPFEPDYRAFSQVVRFRAALPGEPLGLFRSPEELPPGRRVFVLGESAAFGVGVGGNETFAALLDDRLGAQGVHVINAGQPGASAWQVMDAGAQLLARYSPSQLVLFTGNNQWVMWKPPQQRGWNPTVLHILSTLAASRAVAGLEFLLIRGLVTRVDDGKSFHDHHNLEGAQYALRFPLQETPQFGPTDWLKAKMTYLQNFRTSLEVLIRQAKSRGVASVLVTVPFRHRLSPSWKHPQFEAFNPAHRDEVRRLLHEAGALAEEGNAAGALPLLDRALALDPVPPVLHYLRAEALEKLGRLDEAEEAFAQSRELMMGNLGSRLSVNEVIRKVAAAEHVPLVDAEKLFEDYSHQHGKHFNDGLFTDDCHPTQVGHRIIADALEPLLRPAP